MNKLCYLRTGSSLDGIDSDNGNSIAGDYFLTQVSVAVDLQMAWKFTVGNRLRSLLKL